MNWHTFKMRLRRVDASSIHTCCELIQRIRDKTAEDNAPKLEAAVKRHKQTIDTKTPQEKQHEAKQHEAGKSFGGNGQFHSCPCVGPMDPGVQRSNTGGTRLQAVTDSENGVTFSVNIAGAH